MKKKKKKTEANLDKSLPTIETIQKLINPSHCLINTNQTTPKKQSLEKLKIELLKLELSERRTNLMGQKFGGFQSDIEGKKSDLKQH